MLIKERDKHTSGINMVLSILDQGSFAEIGAGMTEQETDIYSPEKVYGSDGVVTGYGTVNGKTVYIYCQDRDTMGGTFGVSHGRKIMNLYGLAVKAKAPVIGILDSAGLRIDESVDGLDAFSALMRQVIRAKKELIQIMVRGMMCRGSMEILAETGDFIFEADDADVAEQIRSLIDVLPCAKRTIPGSSETTDSLNRLCVSASSDAAYPHKILADISDEGFVQEVRPGGGILTSAFIRLDGMTVGALACGSDENKNRKLTLEDIKKATWFIKLCDSLHISLVTLASNDGLSTESNKEEMSFHAARLAEAISEAAMPKVTVITGTVIGHGYTLMSSKGLGADVVFAWPGAQVEMMDSRQAVQILEPDIKLSEIGKKAEEYEHTKCNVQFLIRRGYADMVIAPEESRKYLIGALEAFSNTY